MHMSDALISPIVGGVMWAGSAMTATYAVRKLKNELEDKKIPLMGVMGAFVFAAQMINFTIPGTSSSGHIGGGMLLAILLGPFAGFLTMASVLLIQALFFADGGLLAFGCNLFNLGFFTCFVVYPLIYRVIARKASRKRFVVASVLSAIISLQLGAFSVVLETFLSGKTELPFITFVLFMQPIHLAIGLVEGLITAAVVIFLYEARPDLVSGNTDSTLKRWSYKRVLVILIVMVLVIGGLLSWFASSYPDGLEWSIQKITGETEIESRDSIHEAFTGAQERTAILPDYQFKNSEASSPAIEKAGTTFSGILGSAMTLGLVAIIALLVLIIKKRRRTVYTDH